MNGTGDPGYVRLGPEHPSTQAFRKYLALYLGGSRNEELLSSALRLDHAVIAGSAVFAGSLLPDCSWEAGDLDIWTSCPVEQYRLDLQSRLVGMPVSRLFDDPVHPLAVGTRFEYRSKATRGKWVYFSVEAIDGDDVLVTRVPFALEVGRRQWVDLRLWVCRGDTDGQIVPPRGTLWTKDDRKERFATALREIPVPLGAVASCLERVAAGSTGLSASLEAGGGIEVTTPLAGSKRSAAIAGLPGALGGAGGGTESASAAQGRSISSALMVVQAALLQRHYSDLWDLFKDPRNAPEWTQPVVGHVAQCTIAVSESAAPGAVRTLDVQLVQTSHVPRERPHRIIAGFDLTCCMAAYDGESIWVSESAIPPSGGGASAAGWPLVRDAPGGPRMAINRSSFAGSGFWPLHRTAQRLRKYVARGLVVPPEDSDWLAAEVLARAADPTTLVKACKAGRLQEAFALLRAGAVPLEPGSKLWEPSRITHTPTKAAVILAALEPCVRAFSSPRAMVARAYASSSRVSRSFSGSLAALPQVLSLRIAGFLSGSDAESLPEAAAAARLEWAATDAEFAAAVSRIVEGPEQPDGSQYP